MELSVCGAVCGAESDTDASVLGSAGAKVENGAAAWAGLKGAVPQ